MTLPQFLPGVGNRSMGILSNPHADGLGSVLNLLSTRNKPSARFGLWQPVGSEFIFDESPQHPEKLTTRRLEGFILGKIYNYPGWTDGYEGWTYYVLWLWEEHNPIGLYPYIDYSKETELFPLSKFTDDSFNTMSVSITESLKEYAALLDFIKEKTEESKIVMITSQLTGMYLHVNNVYIPERQIWKPARYIGQNGLSGWDTNGKGKPNRDYYKLQEILEKDGFVKGYDHYHCRVDNEVCQFQKDFYLLDDFLGEPARLSIGKPDAWELVRNIES